jgi:hypothetical protein
VHATARFAALAVLGSLALASAAQAGGGSAPGVAAPSREDYEWMPNGQGAGPELVILVKLSITGKFAVQCGKTWIVSYFGGGPKPPVVQDPVSGEISGTEVFGAQSAGIGSTFASASSDYYLVKRAGPLVMKLTAQPSPWPARIPASASGSLQLTLYAPGSAVPAAGARAASSHKKKRRRAKAKTVVAATCTIPFTAPNHYYEP